MQHRAQAGCRVLVPFAGRKLTGMIVRVHDAAPDFDAKPALKLIDEEPVLDQGLLELARWTANYYCAPLGEVLRAMTPVSAEVKRTKTYALTDAGRDVAKQLALVGEEQDQARLLLQMLEARTLSAAYLAKRLPTAPRLLKDLEKRGLIEVEESAQERDPMRAATDQLEAEFAGRPPEDAKLRKPERELVSFLELHPGPHRLDVLEESVKNASVAARALARRGLIKVTMRSVIATGHGERPPHVLNLHQSAAFDRIHAALTNATFQVFLMQGVTGSGKTEVYLKSIESCLAGGKSALLLVPEIALTPAVAAQFHSRFGDRVAILHSAFSDLERLEQWRRIRQGSAQVVVGTRSGVFAPVRDLGLIIVDEEHDHSYKQGETPRYHGRDVAIVRAQREGAVVVLGSATPSLESRHNADQGKYELLRLPERVEKRPLPEVELVDLRIEFAETRKMDTFSRRMQEEILKRLQKGEQTILLHNRRGFSSFITCRACGNRVTCVNCAVTLTYHQRDRRIMCHYCHHVEPVPSRCPSCDSEYIQFMGTGSEKVEGELHQLFPGARIARLDRDTVTNKHQFEQILLGFRAKEYDILVGTQMIAKGHDLPNVTLVGIVNGDMGLGMPDFRAAERTFQLLTQVEGRAGRGEVPGTVILQTLNPDHYAVRFASAHDYEGFYAREMEFRRSMRYPPFAALANLLVRHVDLSSAERLAAELESYVKPLSKGLHVLGPAAAPVPRLKNEFRFQCLIKSPSRKRLSEILQGLVAFTQEKKWPATALVIDVDPVSLL